MASLRRVAHLLLLGVSAVLTAASCVCVLGPHSVRRLSLADESGTDADEPPLFPVAQGSGSGDNDLAPLSETQDDSELSPGPTSDSGSDSSASGVTESELEPPDANREQVARPAAGTPATAYIPRHHWDTRYSAKVRRTTAYASAKARTHWSSFRTAVIGRKSPLGRLAAAVRGVLTPGGGAAADTPGSNHTGTPELATRLSFDKHGSPRAPESSPMVLTIQSTPQPAWRKCLLAARLPLVLVAALLFMGLLGWLLMGIAPGLKEQPLLSQRDRDAACAAGGVPYEMVTKMIEAAAARQREEQATVLGAYEKACADVRAPRRVWLPCLVAVYGCRVWLPCLRVLATCNPSRGAGGVVGSHGPGPVATHAFAAGHRRGSQERDPAPSHRGRASPAARWGLDSRQPDRHHRPRHAHRTHRRPQRTYTRRRVSPVPRAPVSHLPCCYLVVAVLVCAADGGDQPHRPTGCGGSGCPGRQ